MFKINEDFSIYATRGDIVFFSVLAEDDGVTHIFKAGDVVRIKIYGKKNATEIALQKDFPVLKDTESVEIYLTREETKIGDVISKPKDYWYEIVVNDDTKPQTIIGYDDDGAKVFKLFPEGKDLVECVPDAEDIPFVDAELDLLSPRPLQNQAIARAFVQVRSAISTTENKTTETESALATERARIDNLVSGATAEDSELVDVRIGADGASYGSAGTAVRMQISEVDTLSRRMLAKLEGGTIYENIVYGSEWAEGYLTDTDGVTTGGSNGETHTESKMAVTPGNSYEIRYIRNHTGTYGWLAVSEYDASGNLISRKAYDEYSGQFGGSVTEADKTVFYFNYTVTAETHFVRVSCRTWLTDFVSAKAVIGMYGNVTYTRKGLPTTCAEGDILKANDGVWTAITPASINPNVKSVNHRGYNSVAPENTLSAYKLSKKMGFDIVEADVSFTADGYAVLLHDETVDRTSSGTGTISKLTFEYVRSLDFGSWKSTDYTGEQIPTFEEFISLCRKLGLHPYIEIKYPATAAQIEHLVDTVKRYGMIDKVTWITASGSQYLGYIRNVHASARLGLVVTAITENHISDVLSLRNGTNEVFIDAVSEETTDEMIALCADNGIPVEAWDLWSPEQIASANSYISGFTTDTIIAGAVLYKSEQ